MKRQSLYADPAELQQKNQDATQHIPVLEKQYSKKNATPPLEQSQEQPQHEKPKTQSTPKELIDKGFRPEFPDEQKKALEDGDRQLKGDLRYTSVMKKRKDIGSQEAKQKVEKIEKRSDNVLMRIKAVFPFDLFPNTLIIDANKVTIIDSIFFASESVISILLEEITDVTVDSNFFLAKLNITYSHHPLRPEHYSIPALRKKEALKAKDIIQGLLVLRISEGIDLSKLKPDEIVKQLEGIGKTHENLSAL